MSEFKIEKGVPQPKRITRFPYRDMTVGDSVFCEDESLLPKVRANAYHMGRKINATFTVRKCDGGFRVWRVK